MRRLALLVPAMAAALMPQIATAGILLEAELAGTPIRLETGSDPNRALAQVAGAGYLLQLDRGEVVELAGGRHMPPTSMAGSPSPALTLEQWSEGPLVADYGTTYHVLIGSERICGEVLSSPWMTSFTEPLVQSLELLQAALPALAPQPQGDCGTIGFRAYAADGFPLMAGYRGRPVFKVTLLRFDHYPTAGPLPAPGASAAP
jgi:hypothetical protein